MPNSLYKTILLLCGFCASHTLLAQEIQAPVDDLSLALRDLQNMEIEYSNTDPRLAEPLFQLAQEYRSNGRYQDAHSALDRGQQIIRISEGLYTRAQIPYIQQKIDNYADWQRWGEARNLLQHLLWLHRTKSRYISGPLIADFMELYRLHLRGISEDSLEFQAYHFRRAAAANWLALASAERLWGNRDARVVPIIYELVKQYHLQAEAVADGGRTSYELREVIPGSDWVRDRNEVRAQYHDTGRRLLSQIRTIYAENQPLNLEAVAMANLYLADWEVVFDNTDSALDAYEVAYQNLALAGVDSRLRERYFSTPSLLPETRFHMSLQNAISAKETFSGGEVGAISDAQAALYFAEWSPTAPYVRAPFVSDRYRADSNFALFSFNLSGVTEMSRWLNRGTVQSFGELLNVTLLQPDMPSSELEADFRKRIERLHFRPRLEGGLPTATEARLVYQPAINLN